FILFFFFSWRQPGSTLFPYTTLFRSKNSIGLNGGVSGIAGSFMGFNYSTNNFLGLGETLSIDSQLGTRMRNVSLGFTEPYFLDRDRKSTRLNSSHVAISYAVFCLKKK